MGLVTGDGLGAGDGGPEAAALSAPESGGTVASMTEALGAGPSSAAADIGAGGAAVAMGFPTAVVVDAAYRIILHGADFRPGIGAGGSLRRQAIVGLQLLATAN